MVQPITIELTFISWQMRWKSIHLVPVVTQTFFSVSETDNDERTQGGDTLHSTVLFIILRKVFKQVHNRANLFDNVLNIPHYKTLDIQPLSIIVINASRHTNAEASTRTVQ